MIRKRFSFAAYSLALVGGVSVTMMPSAQAQWYVSGNAGLVFLSDSDFNDAFAGGNTTGEFEFDDGFGFSGAMGYSWGKFRLEGEISYRENDLDQGTVDTFSAGSGLFTNPGTGNIEGDTDAWGFMANVWYDFDTGTSWVPFLGVGIGVAEIGVDLESILGVPVSFDESDKVFAYQIGGGIGYKITPMATLTLSYRFFGTDDPEFDDGFDNLVTEYKSHNIMAGINFRF